ncbi:MAG: hypothetical protein ACH255_09050, partial [Candidatus Thiodiazotropha sp.]
MRISKIRLAKLEARAREKTVVGARTGELRQRMETADARIQKRHREKLSPEDYDAYKSSRDAYYETYSQKWIE